MWIDLLRVHIPSLCLLTSHFRHLGTFIVPPFDICNTSLILLPLCLDTMNSHNLVHADCRPFSPGLQQSTLQWTQLRGATAETHGKLWEERATSETWQKHVETIEFNVSIDIGRDLMHFNAQKWRKLVYLGSAQANKHCRIPPVCLEVQCTPAYLKYQKSTYHTYGFGTEENSLPEGARRIAHGRAEEPFTARSGQDGSFRRTYQGDPVRWPRSCASSSWKWFKLRFRTLKSMTKHAGNGASGWR